MALMFQPFARYVDFQGRARRSEYWLWVLFLFLVNSVLSVFQFSATGAGVMSAANDSHSAAAMGGVAIVLLVKFVFALAVLLPTMAVSVRRMHDTNRTGWWIVFPTVVTLVAMIVVFSLQGEAFINNIKSMQSVSNSSDPRASIALVMSIIRPIMWIVLPIFLAKLLTFVFRVMDGTPGNNRFGPDPKGRGGNISVF